ncbi:helix-turn-helix transcriptional regulator [Vibrio sp. 1-2 (7-a)]|nr:MULTISPECIES: helix-turn-helix transcriptional regulator [Vibrio]NNN58861.1 helix-turn-helix transcriptional regulator [Vibrio sp. 1-2 (7-a)]
MKRGTLKPLRSFTVTQKSKIELRRELGLRIKKARVKSELTLSELALMVGINRITLGRIEDGASQVGAFTLLSIANVTKRPFLWLMFGNDIPEEHKIIEGFDSVEGD